MKLLYEPAPTDAPLIELGALQSLLGCERLFYLQHVEGPQAGAGDPPETAAVHQNEQFELAELASAALGLRGKVRLFHRPGVCAIPHHQKQGRCRRDDDDAPLPWESDRLHAAASAMLLESATGEAVPEARVRYEADRVTVSVSVDERMRAEVRRLISRARALRRSPERPAILATRQVCHTCPMSPTCLPEEVRHAEEPDLEPIRLFGHEQERRALHVLTGGTTVDRSGPRLVVRPRGGREVKHASETISSVLLHGAVDITADAIHLCVDKQIAVHWFGGSGKPLASLTPPVGQAHRRMRQYAAASDAAVCLRLARKVVGARLEAQGSLLSDLAARCMEDDERRALHGVLANLNELFSSLPHIDDIDLLRERAQRANARYIAAFTGASSSLPPSGLEAILYFGYGVLEAEVLRAVLATGLEPAIGFFHTAAAGAHPLILDLMELLRTSYWEAVVVESVHAGLWDGGDDFDRSSVSLTLNEAGKQKTIGLLDARLAQSWRHPVLNYTLSRAQSIELEARLLEKEWSGEPGLFARSLPARAAWRATPFEGAEINTAQAQAL